MAGRIPSRIGRLAVALASVVCTAVPAPSQESAGHNPHDGEWSLEFRVQTRPGGEPLAVGGDTQIVNLLFHAARESFSVAADGAISWEQREGGLLHWDHFSSVAASAGARIWVQDQQPMLRVVGKAIATPAPAGSGRTYDRKLTLDLAWTGGNGFGIGTTGPPFHIALSADGSQWTTNLGTTRPAPLEKSQCVLEPASVQREELAPDMIRETTIFRLIRATATTAFTAPHSVPITERIEVKHVRYPQLVPRG